MVDLWGGIIYIYIYPISPSTSFIIVVVTTTIPESSTSRQQPPIPDQSRACFSDSTPTGSYFRFRVFAVFAFFAVFAVFAVFAFSRGLPLHHRGPRHTFRMHSCKEGHCKSHVWPTDSAGPHELHDQLSCMRRKLASDFVVCRNESPVVPVWRREAFTGLLARSS